MSFADDVRGAFRSVVKLQAELDAEERAHLQTIDDRDKAQDAADKLADAIATLFGEEIGEHSNLNCPWYNALEIIEEAIRNKQPT